jgi:hypothetical protein
MIIFDIAHFLESELLKICHFFHEISEASEVLFLESANIIFSVTIPIINFIKCYGR